MSLIEKAKNLNFRRMGKETWAREKAKAAGFLKIAEQLGGKHVLHQHMKRAYYRHIDKAIEGKCTSRDYKHWRKIAKSFKNEMVGEPTSETLSFLKWLEGFQNRVKLEAITKDDREKWLPSFRKYMESCEANGFNLYIQKQGLIEMGGE